MKKRASYISILFIALISVMQSMAQSSQPDVVCMGTSKNYYVEATPGSTYIWKINGGSPEASTTNSVEIHWTRSGIYILTVQETTKDNCLGWVQTLQVNVIEPPTLQLIRAIDNESQTIVLGSAIKAITYSFGGGATGVTVTGLPDGVKYEVNENTVTISGIPTASGNYSITTVGGAPCAEVSLKGSIKVYQLSTATISGTTITCQNAASAVVTFTGASGTPPYTFTYNINGGTNKTVTTTTGDTVTVSVPTTVSGIFAYNLVDVTDSKGYTNAQTGIATITIHKPTYSTTKRTVCPNQIPYPWNGIECPGPGTYQSKNLKNSDGCDSIATLELIVKPLSASITKFTICQGESYSFNGKSYNSSGIYYVTLSDSVECDSIAILELTVNLVTSSITKASICQGESYFFNGKSYDNSGTYNVSLFSSVGCDSIATLELTVIPSSASITKRAVCQLQLPFKWNGISCPNSGTYKVRLTNANNCDSIASLELILQSPLISTNELTLCSSELPYKWNNTLCTAAGTYSYNLRTLAGCDSIATLILKVNTPTTAMKSASFCEGESYPYNGKLYSAPGSYDVPLRSVVNGCDSIVTLVLKQNTGSYTSQSIRLFSGETYSFNGHVYSQAGVYTDSIKVADRCADVVVTDLSFINIPNTITPNGDGMNDVFMGGYQVQIFNRNGIQLFDGTEGWDGKYKNKTVSQDTYFYVLYYNSESRIMSKEGYIMVIP